MLSGYRIVWLAVFFDLPVETKAMRKAATRFRNDLLDLGFERAQFSVYMRFFASDKQADTVCTNIEKAVPEYGSVKILRITDKQYERIITYHGRSRDKPAKTPEQYEMF
ncbi:unnamed protein product [Cyprideis torosa]|uniref:Uncharacterized protein n=1 Tax=Cyprideis torosa TaxID=163714 RepID=A0A7R8WV63_9CRUS|nr:unnamed protein product [Cyprideis torosa]CAG0911046.1 unnamed protein product [Cyprideis torosa]